MLADKEFFAGLEKELRDRGIIGHFEDEHGKITGRMMITNGEIPDDLKGQIGAEEGDAVFAGTFDFCDASVGMTVDTKAHQPKGGLWVIPDASGGTVPTKECCEFFMATVMRNIDENGNYGVPMCTFCSDTADFTVVPTNDQE